MRRQELYQTSTSDQLSNIAGRIQTQTFANERYFQGLQQAVESSNTEMTGVGHTIRQVQDSVNNIETRLPHLLSTAAFHASNSDTLTRIFRTELSNVLQPILESSFTKSEARNEAMTLRMQTSIEDFAHDVGRKATSEGVFSDMKSAQTQTSSVEESYGPGFSDINADPSSKPLDSTTSSDTTSSDTTMSNRPPKSSHLISIWKYSRFFAAV